MPYGWSRKRVKDPILKQTTKLLKNSINNKEFFWLELFNKPGFKGHKLIKKQQPLQSEPVNPAEHRQR